MKFIKEDSPYGKTQDSYPAVRGPAEALQNYPSAGARCCRRRHLPRHPLHRDEQPRDPCRRPALPLHGHWQRDYLDRRSNVIIWIVDLITEILFDRITILAD